MEQPCQILCTSQDCIFGKEERGYYYQDKFYKHLNLLTHSEHNHIWRASIAVLDKYYNFLINMVDTGLDPAEPISFINLFTKTTDINQTNIESVFGEFIIKIYGEVFKPIDCEIPSIEGIYWFTDINHNLLYVGKSKNLAERIPNSYLQKLPYGIHFFNFCQGDNHADLMEAVLIDYYMPLLNNKKESEHCTENQRTYAKVILLFSDLMKDNSYIFSNLLLPEKKPKTQKK